jgi:glyoxylase-like metal-dependent hydrolase (beta-lactamase superfamily II)
MPDTTPPARSARGAAALSTALPDWLHPVGPGIWAVDSGFERPLFDSPYLMVHDGRAAFLDTAHNGAVPRLLGALEALGLARDAVDWVIPTHVHLDHAGGAGLLLSQLPNARALVHPRGVRHLVDPGALTAGAVGVYGAATVERVYGRIVPMPAERVVASEVLDRPEGMTVDLAGRPLRLIDTPGHARHCHCIWDAASGGWFTGDSFGISYRDTDGPRGVADCYIMPSSPPVQFEPEAMRASWAAMLATAPSCVYVAHFSRLPDPAALVAQMGPQMDTLEAGGQAWLDRWRAAAAAAGRAPGRDEAALADLDAAMLATTEQALMGGVMRSACTLSREAARDFLDVDIRLNAKGVAIWLRKRAQQLIDGGAVRPA